MQKASRYPGRVRARREGVGQAGKGLFNLPAGRVEPSRAWLVVACPTMHGPARPGRGMYAEALLRAALREAGYGPDAIGSALPRIMRILQAEDVRIEAGRPLSRKEREYVRVQLELGVDVSEILAGLKRCFRQGFRTLSVRMPLFGARMKTGGRRAVGRG